MWKQLLEFLRQKLKGENGVRLVVFLGIAGLVLILLSGFLPDKAKPSSRAETSRTETTASDLSMEQYCRQTEQQLVSILEQVEGVGTCQVMLTADEYLRNDLRTGSGTGAGRIPHQDPEEMRDRFRQRQPAASGAAGSCTGDQRRDRGVQRSVQCSGTGACDKGSAGSAASRRQPHLCGSGGVVNTLKGNTAQALCSVA